jgi:hypothetical protein
VRVHVLEVVHTCDLRAVHVATVHVTVIIFLCLAIRITISQALVPLANFAASSAPGYFKLVYTGPGDANNDTVFRFSRLEGILNAARSISECVRWLVTLQNGSDPKHLLSSFPTGLVHASKAETEAWQKFCDGH